jgi:hypothetical protein
MRNLDYGLQRRSGPGPTRQRDRSCINTRRRANIVIHANTAKTSSEKNEYFLKDVFACFLQGVHVNILKVDMQRLHEVEEVTTGPLTLFLGVNVSRYQL